MKIMIGVTREPEKIKDYLCEHRGLHGTLIEIGPFVSRMEAFNWLVYLKSRIGSFQEIYPETKANGQSLWYGFTFEQPAQVKGKNGKRAL
ncbi:hypothetical protein [Desulforhopalus sp. IMCC35007]|uniref:hypothetical protein n=1 Tax=Desulforhopalus sp. IMCC35007 TaxID=2569543 RepID=UPI0010AE5E55|nr:hypothetical protein [Desulforhopalus sp. IMCC35007]TKB11695.1 hypothetical protein FCL48_02555 [Desulforhopalus sp. IMCC35007]